MAVIRSGGTARTPIGGTPGAVQVRWRRAGNMRTLLIDNYDSFTYNLWHYLAELNGRPPVVIRNDDPRWRLGDLAHFDNVVISPGPGTPYRAADFGICREVIEHARVPLLGVCLGHQGIAYAHGGTVGPAPEPRHGRLSPVEHRDDGLFAGVPSPFQVVRYHSLAVTSLPEELEATAWTPDGVLMALRHRDRPIWGLQFHPESIRTQYGRRILANFRDLTRGVLRDGGPARPRPVIEIPRPSPSPRAAAAAAPRPRPDAPPAVAEPRIDAEVLVRSLPTRWHDEVVFAALFGDSPYAFWLDSSLTHGEAGRFSVMGDASGPLARTVSADVRRGTVTVTEGGRARTARQGFLDWLDRDLRRWRTRVPELPLEFALGWVGYLGYELKAECGGADAHRSPTPDANLVFADRAIVFDHATGTTYLLALAAGGDDAAALAWFADTTARLEALAGVRPGPPGSPGTAGPVRLRHDRDRYLELIAACREAIDQGETYEVCLTNMLHVSGEFDPWECYRTLRRISPATFGAYLRLGEVSVLSSSPERFLRVSADGTVESKPIKGTRPRGRTAAEDTLIAKELATCEKDLAENLMIVDLVRNDLGRVAEIGSVHVAKIFDVETYATVHQLVSTVRARLRPGASAVDCVRAAFPGGSMTGAPKIRTMRIIDELEAGPRGVYSGAVGFLSLSGAADLSMVIRTAVITPEGLSYGVGGAIVALSDPDAEYEETAVKAIPLLRALGIAFPGAASAARAAACGSPG
jgi:aminodeoxychorismate synthase, component I, bacterial clade